MIAIIRMPRGEIGAVGIDEGNAGWQAGSEGAIDGIQGLLQGKVHQTDAAQFDRCRDGGDGHDGFSQ